MASFMKPNRLLSNEPGTAYKPSPEGMKNPHKTALASQSGRGMASGVNPYGLGPGTVGLQDIGRSDPALNPFLDKMIGSQQDRMTQQFREDVLPSLVSHFANTGNLDSSAHALTLGRAGGELARSMADYDTGMRFGAYEQDANRRLQALGQLSGQEFTGREQDLSRRYNLFNQQQQRDLTAKLSMTQMGIQQQQHNANLMVQAGIMSRQNAELAMQAAEWLQTYGQAKSLDDKRRFEEQTGANYDFAMYLRQLLGNAPGISDSSSNSINIGVGAGGQ